MGARDAVEEQSDDEWFWENDGVTRADLDALVGGAEKSKEIRYAEGRYDLYDAINDILGGTEEDFQFGNDAGEVEVDVVGAHDEKRGLAWGVMGYPPGDRVEGLVDKHAYAVMAPTRDGAGVILRDPSGLEVNDPDRQLSGEDSNEVRLAQGQSVEPSGDEKLGEEIGGGFFRLTWEEFARIGDSLTSQE